MTISISFYKRVKVWEAELPAKVVTICISHDGERTESPCGHRHRTKGGLSKCVRSQRRGLQMGVKEEWVEARSC